MKFALITGATSGIGFELAKLFAQNGYGLVLVSSNQNHLDNVKNSLVLVNKYVGIASQHY